MDLINSLRSFLRLTETGSFSAVAVERGLTQPAISRQIRALEAHLGTRLVQRTTQAVTLTAEGADLVGPARELVDAADGMLQAAAHRQGRPVGRVRLALPVSLGLQFSSSIGGLLSVHRELVVELVLRDRSGNLVEEGLDLEVRVGPIEDSTTISRRIGWMAACLVASPEYLEARGVPQSPADLTQHDCIVHHRGGKDSIWWFGGEGLPDKAGDPPVSVRGRFSANNGSAIHRAVLAGQGIASLPHLMVGEDLRCGRLRQLLPECPLRRQPICVTYASRRSLPPRTRAVIDYLMALFRDDAVWQGEGVSPRQRNDLGMNATDAAARAAHASSTRRPSSPVSATSAKSNSS